MTKTLDMRGYSCPIPLLKTRDALPSCDELIVLVDEPAARENVTKFAKSQNCTVDCTGSGAEWSLRIKKIPN